jgi:hypothetical protein
MELKEIIKQTAAKYGITRKQLLNTGNFHYTAARREVAYLAITCGFNFADLERETQLSKTTWSKAYKAYKADTDVEAVKQVIANDTKEQTLAEVQQHIDEVKAQTKEFTEEGEKVTKILGFEFSEKETIRYKCAIAAAKRFMRNYGKGTEVPRNSYGRIVKHITWYN